MRDSRGALYFITDEKQNAIQHLIALWNVKCKLTKDNINANINQATSNNDAEAETVSKMEMLLRQREIENEESRSPGEDHIRSDLIKFGMVKRSLLGDSTIDFWAKNKTIFKDVYELSKIVNAVPVTQVTVERAFSSVAFILTALRNSLSPDTLENILIIRLNKEIYRKIPLI